MEANFKVFKFFYFSFLKKDELGLKKSYISYLKNFEHLWMSILK